MITIDRYARQVYWNNELVPLTYGELRVVTELIDSAPRSVSFRRLYDVFKGKQGLHAGAGEEGYRANVRTSVKRIRMKFKRIKKGFNPITTYNGFGYCWTAIDAIQQVAPPLHAAPASRAIVILSIEGHAEDVNAAIQYLRAPRYELQQVKTQIAVLNGNLNEIPADLPPKETGAPNGGEPKAA